MEYCRLNYIPSTVLTVISVLTYKSSENPTKLNLKVVITSICLLPSLAEASMVVSFFYMGNAL